MKLIDKLFKTNNLSEPHDLTVITRIEILEGFSILGIIQNMAYYFTDIQVYSDGLINCWGMVDLPMFKDKLNKNWVVTSIPDGETISIFSLGSWTIDKGVWFYNKESFYTYVHSLVKKLNPTLENLHNYNGKDSKKVGEANVAKHFIPDPKPYYFENPESYFPKKTSGEKFSIFYRNDDNKTYLAELSIYKNGHVELTNLPNKICFEFTDLKNLMDKQIITTNLNNGERITVLGLGTFIVSEGEGTDMNSKYNEFVDKYNELRGEEGSIDKCRRIFKEYKETPTLKLKDELKEAYEAVPEHQRIYVGDMDTKDYEVRQIIYGDIIKKEWEENYGDEYPFDDMPKPLD